MRNIPFARPHIGETEKNAASEVLDGHVLVHGHRTHDFEDNFRIGAVLKNQLPFLHVPLVYISLTSIWELGKGMKL